MDCRVIFSRPALRDLGEIARCVAQENPNAAERVGMELIKMAESLMTMPWRGGNSAHGQVCAVSCYRLTS